MDILILWKIVIVSISIVAGLSVLILMPLERTLQDKTKRFVFLRNIIEQLDSQIIRLLELHPTIKETSTIEGKNSNHYMDQGIIRDKRREYLFPINTPLIEWTKKNSRSSRWLDMDTNIEVEGTVENYSISVEYLCGREKIKVVFNSSTGEFIETLIKLPKKKLKDFDDHE